MNWAVWVAVLAALPHVASDIVGPAIPGQISVAALASIIMLSITWSILAPHVSRRSPDAERLARRMGAFAGRAGTAVLLVVEMYAVIRGPGYLLSESQILINDIMSLFELLSVVVAFVGLFISVPDHSQAEEAPTGRLPLAFLIGGLWPALCNLLVEMGVAASRFSELVLCVVTGCAAFALCRLRGEGAEKGSSDEALLLMTGLLSYGVARSLYTEFQFVQALQWVPAGAVYLGFLIVHLIWSGFLLLVCRRGMTPGAKASSCQRGGPDTVPNERPLRSVAPPESLGNLLTKREMEILSATVHGMSASQIAEKLGLAKPTVGTYRRRLYEKLGVGGLEELLELADSWNVDSSAMSGVQPPQTKEAKREAAGGSSERRRFAMAFVLLAVVLAACLVHFPQEVMIGGSWYQRCPSFVMLAVCAMLIAIGTLRICRRRSAGFDGGAQEVEKSLPASLVAFFLTWVLASSLYCTWSSLGPSGFWYVASLLVCSLSFGLGLEGLGTGICSRARGLALALVKGFKFLFIDELKLALLAVGALLIADQWASLWLSGLIESLRISHLLLLLMGATLLVVKVRAQAQLPIKLDERRISRASHYLMGRGLSELQAQVVLDLACGCHVQEICNTRCTTVATVRSCRYRSYRKLGIHSLSELRLLLSRKAGITSFSKSHTAG